MVKRALVAAVFLGCAALGAGCSTQTSVTHVWQAQLPPTPPMRRVLVLTMSTDEPMRKIIEDAFVKDLAKHGVTATPSYTLFGKGQRPTTEQARAMVANAHYDGILVTRLHGVRDNVSEDSKVAESSGFWDGYYMQGWGYGNAYVVDDETVTFENTLWDTRADTKRVWTAETKTVNPENGADFAHSLTKAVDPALTTAHFISPEPK